MDPRGILTSKYIANYTGPILFVDTSIVAGKIAAFKQAMPRVGINYAVKSNPHVSILSAVARAGGSFDVA
jgi:diaminopimelate decarboxylase